MNLINIQVVEGKAALDYTGPLRVEVFEHEQGFVDEFDELDDVSFHVMIELDNMIIASGRMYEEHPHQYHLGRIVVKQPYRGQGHGKVVVETLVNLAKEKGAHQCVLSSQTHACAFYESCGFIKEGDVYLEQGQPHQWMVHYI